MRETKPGSGVYCVSTTVPVKNVVGVADAVNKTTELVLANFSQIPEAITEGCPASTTALIAIRSVTKIENEAADFWISFN